MIMDGFQCSVMLSLFQKEILRIQNGKTATAHYTAM
jgi:hypothetical protein